MLDLFSGTLLATFSTVLFIFVLSWRAHHIGLVDAACSRKIHEDSIPTVGGIAILGGFLLALFFSSSSQIHFFGFALPALLLVSAGAIDDLIAISHKVRFLVQILAGVLMAVLGGVVIEQLGELVLTGTVLNLGMFAIPFTVFFLMGLANAFNLLDGIDGLVGTLALIALSSLGVVAYIGGHFPTLLEMLLLAGCLIAFLGFNSRFPWRKRAGIFLGDSGSTFLGFALLWFSITLSQGEQAAMTPVTTLWIFALPLFDMTTIFIRRIVSKRAPFEADREHLHHIFLTAGFSVGHTVLIVASIAILLSAIGIAGLYLGIPENAMCALFLALLAGYYHLVAQSWKRRIFFGYEICRRSGKTRRQGDFQAHAGNADHKAHVDTFRIRGNERRDIEQSK